MLDDLDCSLADRFEDCTHRGWGVHNCIISESVGVICNPGPSGTKHNLFVTELLFLNE